MTTEKQISANQANGAKSVGPVTEEGKDSSRRNALKHGLTAETLLLDGEDSEAFYSLRDALIDEQAPHGPYESELIERLVYQLWRLRRVPVLEAAVITWTKSRLVQAEPGSDLKANPKTARNDSALNAALNKAKSPASKSRVSRTPTMILQGIGQAMDALFANNITGKMERYETHLWRQVRETRAALHTFSDERAREAQQTQVLVPRNPDLHDQLTRKMMSSLKDRHR
jgi:hypothetical protein